MSNLRDIEVELKFPLNNPNNLEKELNRLCYSKFETNIQKDTYYNPPHLDFLEEKPISRWLRLRETKNKNTINYKDWKKRSNGEDTTFCEELESMIDNIESVKKILLALDFKKIITVDKHRRTWIYNNTEIAIDLVENLGAFIEIEAKGDFKDEREAEKHLYNVLEELNADLGEQDFKGYPYLLLEKLKLI